VTELRLFVPIKEPTDSGKSSYSEGSENFPQSIRERGKLAAEAIGSDEIGLKRIRLQDGPDRLTDRQITLVPEEGMVVMSSRSKFVSTNLSLFTQTGNSSGRQMFDPSIKIVPKSVDYESSTGNIFNDLKIGPPAAVETIRFVQPKEIGNLPSTTLKASSIMSSMRQIRLSLVTSESLVQNKSTSSSDSSALFLTHENSSKTTFKTSTDGVRETVANTGLSSAAAIGLAVTSLVAFWLILGPLLCLLASRSLRRARAVKDRMSVPRRLQQGYGRAETGGAIERTSAEQIFTPLARAKLYRTNLLDDCETERFQVTCCLSIIYLALQCLISFCYFQYLQTIFMDKNHMPSTIFALGMLFSLEIIISDSHWKYCNSHYVGIFSKVWINIKIFYYFFLASASTDIIKLLENHLLKCAVYICRYIYIREFRCIYICFLNYDDKPYHSTMNDKYEKLNK